MLVFLGADLCVQHGLHVPIIIVLIHHGYGRQTQVLVALVWSGLFVLESWSRLGAASFVAIMHRTQRGGTLTDKTGTLEQATRNRDSESGLKKMLVQCMS